MQDRPKKYYLTVVVKKENCDYAIKQSLACMCAAVRVNGDEENEDREPFYGFGSTGTHFNVIRLDSAATASINHSNSCTAARGRESQMDRRVHYDHQGDLFDSLRKVAGSAGDCTEGCRAGCRAGCRVVGVELRCPICINRRLTSERPANLTKPRVPERPIVIRIAGQ